MVNKSGNVKVNSNTAKLNEILQAKNKKIQTSKGPQKAKNNPKFNSPKNFIRRSGPRGG